MSETVRLEVDEVGPSEEFFTGSLDWSGCAGFEDDVEACESVFDVEVRFADYGDRLVANLGEFGSYELLSVDGVTYVGNAQAPFSGVICGDVESIGSWVISMVPSQLSVRADGSDSGLPRIECPNRTIAWPALCAGASAVGQPHPLLCHTPSRG